MNEFIKNECMEISKKYRSNINFNSSNWIEKFIDQIDWVDWVDISKYQKLSESFIREFKNEVEWYYISQYQKLSDSFIKEFKNKVYWNYISQYQKLSESFIREFKNEVDWYYISKYQKLSESFIKEFKNKVDWGTISHYQKLSESFRKEFDIQIPENNWLYTLTKEKINYIKENTKYEVLKDSHKKSYIIAYKGIRSDRYSKYNFQYQYLKDKTYECHCDYNLLYENSFGLSAWTEKKAREYCKQLIVKVKIYIEDIGAIVHDGNKIRCSKFKVLT